jgi:TolB protein
MRYSNPAAPLRTTVVQSLALCWLCICTLFLSGCAQPASNLPSDAPTSHATDLLRGEQLQGRLLFVRNGTVWLWQGDTGRPLFGNGTAFQPRFSPDGRQIVYVNRGNSYSDLLIADQNGQVAQPLTRNESGEPPNSFGRAYSSRWALYPTWSPDGENLLFTSQAGPPFGEPAVEYNLALYRFMLSELTYEVLSSAETLQVSRSVHHPTDELQIVFAAVEAGTEGQQLYRLSLIDDQLEPLPGLPQTAYDPTFSTDGQWLAFAGATSERTDIYAVATSYTAPAQRITSLGSARAPAFSPDGSQLAFLALDSGGGFDLWVVDLRRDENGALQATNPRQITDGLGLDADSGISWGP